MTEIPLIDAAILHETKAIMKTKFPTMLEYFAEDTEMYILAIQEAIHEINRDKITISAHTIKSSSRQIGALRISTIAHDIEHLALQGCTDIFVFTDLLERLKQAMTETTAAFAAMEP